MESKITDRRGRHGSIRRTYHYDGERGGYSLLRSACGWIVDTWSRESGSKTGRRVLVPYALVRPGIHPDCQVNAGGTTYAQLILEYAQQHDSVRVLRHGTVVR